MTIVAQVAIRRFMTVTLLDLWRRSRAALHVKATVKAISAMADYFGKMAESSSNAEVKKALLGIQKGYDKLSDLYDKILLKNDLAAAADAAVVTAELQESLDAFAKLCAA